MKNNYITLIIVAVIFGVVGFISGTQYQKNKSSISTNRMGRNYSNNISQGNNNGFGQQGNTINRNSQGMNRRGNGLIIGKITAKDEQSITIKTQDGSSKIIILSTDTKVNKNISGSLSDLKVGEQVTAMGTSSTDGTSVTATSISLGSFMPQRQGMPDNSQGIEQPPTN